MIDLSIIAQAGAFISVFAAISAGIIMAKVTKKFGTGILALKPFQSEFF